MTARHCHWVFFGFLTLYPLLLIAQGIDFTDQGFNLVNQWLLFEHADSYAHGYLFYLSNLLGGLWLAIVRPLGLLGAKFGWVLIIYATVYLSHRALRETVCVTDSLAGLSLALLWMNHLQITWVNYNHLTGLFFAAGALALFRGLTLSKDRLVSIAGILFGASTFLRFPNVLSLGFVVCIPLYAVLSGRAILLSIRQVVNYLVSFVLGIALLLLLMMLLGHEDNYISAFIQRFSTAANDPNSNYSANALLSLLWSDYSRLAGYTLMFLLGIGLAAFSCARPAQYQIPAIALLAVTGVWLVGGSATGVYGYFVLTVIAASAACLWLLHLKRLSETAARNGVFLGGLFLAIPLALWYMEPRWQWLVPGLLCVILGHRFIVSRVPQERLLLAMAIGLMLVIPMGSDNGLFNCIFAVWLALPLAFHCVRQLLDKERDRQINRHGLLFAALGTLVSMSALAAESGYRGTYRDTANRLMMTSSVEVDFLRGSLTTAARAKSLEQVVVALNEVVSEGEPLLIHGSCALLHLLTRTRPVLGASWNGVYPPATFAEKLAAFEASGAEAPPVVLSRGSCRDREWPMLKRAPPSEQATARILSDYLQRHHYSAVWQNDFFVVLQSAGPSARS